MACFCSSLKADTKASLVGAVARSDHRELEHLLATPAGKKQVSQNREFGVGLLYYAVEVFSQNVHSKVYGEPPYGRAPVKYAFECVKILCPLAPAYRDYDYRENYLPFEKQHHLALQVLFDQHVMHDKLVTTQFRLQDDLLIPCTKLLLDRAAKPREEKVRAMLQPVLVDDVIALVESYDSERVPNYAGMISLRDVASSMASNYAAIVKDPAQMDRLIQLVDLLAFDGAKISQKNFNSFIEWKTVVLAQKGPVPTIPRKQWARLTHALQKAISK